MKNLLYMLFFGLLFLGFFSFVFAQDTILESDNQEVEGKEEKKIEDKNIDDYYIDFSIPDLSAFSLLGVNTNNVARPGNIKEFSIAVLDFAGKDGKINPGIAIEWSPFKTLGSKSLRSYEKNKLLRRIQMSFATAKDSDVTKVAFGLRWVPIDKSDPLISQELNKEIIGYLKKFDSSKSSGVMRREFMDKINKFLTDKQPDPSERITIINLMDISNPPDVITFESIKGKMDTKLSVQGISLNENEKEELNNYIEEYIVITKGGESWETIVSERIKKAKEIFEKEAWNAEVLHFALGIIGDSEDATWKKLSLNTFSGFAGYTFPLSKNSQCIFQVQGRKSFNDEAEEKWHYSLGGRFLIGNSKNRFSLEGLYSKSKYLNKNLAEDKWRVTFGGELKLSDGLWLEVALGTVTNGKLEDAGILSLFSLKYALQKKRRFETN